VLTLQKRQGSQNLQRFVVTKESTSQGLKLLQVQVNDPCNGKQETAHAQDMKNGDEEEEPLPAEPLKDSYTSANRAVFPESNPARLQKLSRHLSWACLFLGALQRSTTITSFKRHSSCGSAIK
jgi:hypothetical protein